MNALLLVLALLAWSWAVLALWYFPAWPAAWRWLAVGLALGLVCLLWLFVPQFMLPWILLAGAAVVRILWSMNRPSNKRTWSPDQACLPVMEFDGSRVAVRNVRNAVYRSVSDYDLSWEERVYDLDRIATVDFIMVPFPSWRGLAHVFLTFGFEDGEHLAISIEIRRELTDHYSVLKGMFRHFEIMYVIGDEQDLIGLRANIRKDPVYLYPGKARPDQIRSLFVSMLNNANRLVENPRFYHSLFNNCTTRLVGHINELREDKVGFDWRILFPGYSDKLAWQLNLIDADGSLEQARERCLINGRSAFLPDRRAWSRQIRQVPD